MSGIEVIAIQTVSGFLEYLETEKKKEEDEGNSSDFIFRGQQADKPLLPRLAGVSPRGKRAKIEQLMFKEFKRTGFALGDLKPESPWDFLAIAQHHRLPTRLLDWTFSALAALWFSVETPPGRTEARSLSPVVWLLKTRVDDFVDGSKSESPFKLSRTVIYRPRFITPRIVAQAGLFTVHKMRESEGFIKLEANKNLSKRLVKFIVPPAAIANIRKHLHICGVNAFSLFPDLDGLCRHLEWRYTRMN